MEDKQIEEMAKAVRSILESRTDITFIPDLDKPIAKELAKHYQPKLPENAVVLTKEEHERLTSRRYFITPKRKLSPVEIILAERNSPFVVVPENMDIITIPSEDEIRKETAREISKFVSEHCDDECLVWVLDEFIAKKYGVEVEE